MCVTFLKAILAKLYVGYSPVELQALSFSKKKKKKREEKKKKKIDEEERKGQI